MIPRVSWIYRILFLFHILNGQLSNLIWSIKTVCIIPSNKKNYGTEIPMLNALLILKNILWFSCMTLEPRSEYLFSILKNPSLITSQKLNICIAAKMKHSPNITEIKTWNFLRNTRSRGFKRDFIISLEFWKFWNIIKYSFANFLEITNGKLCFLQRGRGNLAKIKIFGRAQASKISM